ncbi:F-box protein [Musa troglodytarum]|uniref:inositol oxygenase n=1 Tax=Musa troglodytarum TaxID=320322 RepID=A0A9E7GFP5_9LILI|nr:F-box protein [Musa troglodytarum]
MPPLVRCQRGKVSVLCIDRGDDGAMRGILPGKALSYLEKALRSKSSILDTEVSTSLFSLVPSHRSLCGVFQDKGSRGIAISMEAIERVIKKAFKDMMLCNTMKLVLISCYDLDVHHLRPCRRPIFVSYRLPLIRCPFPTESNHVPVDAEPCTLPLPSLSRSRTSLRLSFRRGRGRRVNHPIQIQAKPGQNTTLAVGVLCISCVAFLEKMLSSLNSLDLRTPIDPKELLRDGGFVVPDANSFGHTFRDYNAESEWQKTVEEFYRMNHIHQTCDFVKRMREEYGKLDRVEMSIWECIELLSEFIDESSPDLDEPEMEHLWQTAEAIRKDYPEEDWLHLTGLIDALHKHGAYQYLMNEEDQENLKWLHVFNKYDLYSKSKVRIDVEKVKPYYLSVNEKVQINESHDTPPSSSHYNTLRDSESYSSLTPSPLRQAIDRANRRQDLCDHGDSTSPKPVPFIILFLPSGHRRLRASLLVPANLRTKGVSLPKLNLGGLSLRQDDTATSFTQPPRPTTASEDEHLVSKIHAILDAVADRAEMHAIIGAQRNDWNHLFTNSINAISLTASLMAGISSIPVGEAAPHMLAFKLSSVILFTAATGMMLITSKIQPSQLAEEQRNATRLWEQLGRSIETTLALRAPTQRDVDEAMEKVLALDKAYPLPLLPGMLEKFPEIVEPTRWWPKIQPKQSPQAGGNGWSHELEGEMRGILRVLKAKDEQQYTTLGKLLLNMNKTLAISGPLLAGLAAISSGLIGSPALGPMPAFLGVIGGVLATAVHTLEHGGQVGMVFELFRNCAGYYRRLQEEIASNLGETDVQKRENGELFEMKVALQLGRSLSDLKGLASYASPLCEDEDIKEFAGKLF